MWSWKFFLVKLSLFSCVMFCLGAKPKFKRSKVNYKLSLGSHVRMKCELVKSTGVTVKWIKDGKFMEEKRNSRLRIRTGKVSIFRIWKTERADAGEYECRAQNKFGTASRKLNLILTAGEPLFIKPQGTLLQFLAWPVASDVKLKCEADGARPLTYKWLKNGEPFTSRRHDRKINTSRWFLRIATVVPSDNGMYTCVVSNKFGNISRSYKLTVIEKVRSRPILLIGFPKNKTVKTGSNVTFQCLQLHSTTLTDYRWLKWHNPPNNPTFHGPTFKNSSDYTLINSAQYASFKADIRDVYGGKVILTNVTKKDAGMYTCIVSNHIGSSWRNAFLIIDDSEDAGEDKCRTQNKFGEKVKPTSGEGKPWFIKPPKTSLQFLAWPVDLM